MVDAQIATSAARVAGRNWTDRRQGYLFVAPVVVVLGFFVVYPVLTTFYWSLFSETRTGVAFVGAANYAEALNSRDFWNAVRNSFVFTVTSVSLHVTIGLSLALLLNQPLPFKTTFRVVALVPWMFPIVVVGALWAWLYNPQFGPINDLLLRVGLIHDLAPWLADPVWAMPAIIVASAWRGYPFVMLILLAGLAAIPVEQYEAAAVDGATSWQRFVHVTLPNLRYMMVLATLLDSIYMFRQFDLAQIMTGGGPAGATEVLTTLVYKSAFQYFRNGYGSAIAVMMFAVLFCFSVGYVRLVREQ